MSLLKWKNKLKPLKKNGFIYDLKYLFPENQKFIDYDFR